MSPTTSKRPVTSLAIRIAVSFASEPVLQKKLRASGSGASRPSRSASKMRGAFVKRLPVCISCSAWSAMALATAGCEWPVLMQN
jgi:hypothetical protein